MNTKLAVWVLLVGLAVQALPNTAEAVCGPYFHSGYAVTPWAYQPRSTYIAVRDTIPYFALHPPVYYSHPVYRPYGLSPYADFPVPVSLTSHLATSGLPQGATAEPASYRPETKPLRIINPFVMRSEDPDISPQAVIPRQPQTVYLR